MQDPSRWVYEDDNKHDPARHERERVEQGFSEYDWWNFNSYLDWIIIRGLEKFKTGHGHPVNDQVKTMDDWRAVLDKMIAGFKAHDRLVNDWDARTAKQDRIVFIEGMELFAEYYDTLWD